MRFNQPGRREFIALIGSAAVWLIATCVEPAGAQNTEPPKRLGVMSFLACGRGALHQRLAELGWVEGRTLTIDCVSSLSQDPEQLTLLATELVGHRPDVLVAVPPTFIRALKQATSTIPIVMASTSNPVEAGLVTNLARPEANVTGLAWTGADNTAKRIGLLKQMLPRLARLAVIRRRLGSSPQIAELLTKDANAAASTFGFAWQDFTADVPEDFDNIFAQLAAEGFDAVYVQPSSLLYPNLTHIVELARRHRMPTFSDHSYLAKHGFLLTYGSDPDRDFARAAEYVDKILRGTKPGDLPIELPTTFDLVINLKTAKELGIAVPPALLAIATEVVE
jgi:putative tryptophan/tyrosine transport system substrate-binding protein